MECELPVRERLTGRLNFYGATTLSNSELLAVALGYPNASQAELLLERFGGLGNLQRATPRELQGVKGIGKARANALAASLCLGARIAANPPVHRISSPADAYQLLKDMGACEQEHMVVLILDTRSVPIAQELVYKGSVNSCQVRVGEVFRGAVRANASSIVVAHNHPSGDTSLSQEDIHVTREIVKVGKMLDINVLDHLVIGRGSYRSLKEHGGYELFES